MRGLNASQIAPLVVQEVSTQCINRRTVQEGLLNNRWIGDIRGVLSPQGMIQCFALLAMVATIFRDEQQPDSFTWPWSASGNYSATSTYRMLNQGVTRVSWASCIWGSWAPLKCKIFGWLALQYRLWTSDRRVRHGLQTAVDSCYTCLQESDSVDHVLVQCVYARSTWIGCLLRMGVNLPSPAADATWEAWWMRNRGNLSKNARKELDTFCILVAWSLWKQRNARGFANVNRQKSVKALICQILDEWSMWKRAKSGGRGISRRE